MLDDVRTWEEQVDDFVAFVRAGSVAAGPYHCAVCGYGVTVTTTLPRCPMCSGEVWEPAPLSRPLL